MLREPTRPPRDPVELGISALGFLSEEPDLLSRFLAMTGLTVPQLRQQAERPAFFVGLFDFILAHQPTLLRFAANAHVDPGEVQISRDRLAEPSGLADDGEL